MKIINLHIPKTIRALAIATPLLITSPLISAKKIADTKDVFVRSSKDVQVDDTRANSFAPKIKVADKLIIPMAVVDLSEGTLYHYGEDGTLKNTYEVASGKVSTPTKPALKIIRGIEVYPYNRAPKSTKRYKTPNDYGTHLLNLAEVDSITGNIIGSNGQFLHGTFKPSSIGKKVSNGCVRVHNDVIKKIAEEAKVGQYILIKE